MMQMDAGVGPLWMAMCSGILLLAGLVISAVWLTRDRGAGRRALERRYAAGEIDTDEYYERLYALDQR